MSEKPLKECAGCGVKKPLDEFPRNYPKIHQLNSHCKACNKVMRDAYRSSPEGFFEFTLSKITERSKKKGIACTVTPKDLMELFEMQKGRCAITGEPLTFVRNGTTVLTNCSVDRIDSSRGYTLDNLQLVCQVVNHIRWNLSEDDLVAWLYRILKGLGAVPPIPG